MLHIHPHPSSNSFAARRGSILLAMGLWGLTLLPVAAEVMTPIAVDVDFQETTPLLRELIAEKWGEDRVLLPSPKVWVQYEPDLGERWIVDFESGEVTLECLWAPSVDVGDACVQEAMARAISNLYVTTPVHAERMLKGQQEAGTVLAQIPMDQLVRQDDQWTYVVRKGDVLSIIARRFRVKTKELTALNGLANPNRIKVGMTLLIPVPLPHLETDAMSKNPQGQSLLKGQLVDPETGALIDENTIGAFAEQVVKRNGVKGEIIQGGQGQPLLLTRSKMKMAKNHLQVRADQYSPMVTKYATQFDHNPALIMAMVHTESAFNPMATSAARAYGLMQLVPKSGGREAYRYAFNKDIAPSPAYLLDPKQNLELGTAYMRMLQDRRFAKVRNPTSRLYCAVAAYNGGGGNVGRAFTGRKSIRASIDTINAANPEAVLKRLQTKSPHQETRDYVTKVFERIPLYQK